MSDIHVKGTFSKGQGKILWVCTPESPGVKRNVSFILYPGVGQLTVVVYFNGGENWHRESHVSRSSKHSVQTWNTFDMLPALQQICLPYFILPKPN